jgi:hypothetical protein
MSSVYYNALLTEPLKSKVITEYLYPKIKDANATEEDSDMELISLEYKIDIYLLIRQIKNKSHLLIYL